MRMTGGARAIPLLVEITWRCGATESTARMLARAVREHGIDGQAAGQLGFGRWHEGVSQEALRDLLSALSERGHTATTIAVLGHRLKSHPEELESWREIAHGLVLRSDLVRSSNMTSYSLQRSFVSKLTAARGTGSFSTVRRALFSASA